MSENYENMSNEEIKEQLEWSDHHEFSYNYAIWAFEEIDRLNNIINKCMESVCCIEHNLEKYEEVGLDHFDYALEKTRELKEYLYEELKENK